MLIDFVCGVFPFRIALRRPLLAPQATQKLALVLPLTSGTWYKYFQSLIYQRLFCTTLVGTTSGTKFLFL